MLTLLSIHQEPFAALALGNVQMFRLNPPEQSYSLRKHAIALKVVDSDWSWGNHSRDSWCKGAKELGIRRAARVDARRPNAQVVKSVHNQLFHALHCVIELSVGRVPPYVCFAHALSNELWHSPMHRRERQLGRDGKIAHTEKVIDKFDLISHRERSLREVAQESTQSRSS